MVKIFRSKVYEITVTYDSGRSEISEIVALNIWGAMSIYRKENPETSSFAREVSAKEIEVLER